MICLSLKGMIKAIDTEGTSSSLENRYGRMMFELLRKRAMQSFPACVRECVLEAGRHVYNENICMKFVKSEIVSGEFCSTLRDYDKLRSRVEIFQTRDCVFHDQ